MSIPNFIEKAKPLIRDTEVFRAAKDTDKIELITARVAEREQKLALVNKKLGINPK